METKDFDAVKTMRSIRDELSSEFAGMTFEEQKRYMIEQAHGSNTKVRRGKRSTKQGRRPAAQAN